MSMVQSFMPKIPGLSLGPIQDSTLVSGEGVETYEMIATVSGALGNGKVRLAFVTSESAPNLAILMVTCGAECETAEAEFETMAKTFEFSS